MRPGGPLQPWNRYEVAVVIVIIVLTALGCLASQGLLIRQIIAGNGWS